MSKSNLVKIIASGHGAKFVSLARAIYLVQQHKAEWVAHERTIAITHHEEPLPPSQRHTDSNIGLKFEFWPEVSAGFTVVQWHGAEDKPTA